MKLIFKKYSPITVVGIISFIITLVLHASGAFSLIETKLYDLRFRLRGPIDKHDKDVVLVEIDDESYREIPESYPYPRSHVWSRAIDNLSKAGAKVIVFDIQFDNKDHYSTQLNKIPDNICETCKNIDGDLEFSNSIKEAQENGTTVILASKIGQSFEGFQSFINPVSKIMDANPKIGLVDQFSDNIDNVHRRYPVFYQITDKFSDDYGRERLSIGVQSVLSFKNISINKMLKDVDNNRIKIGPLHISTYARMPAFLINFYGPESNKKYYSTFDSYPLSWIIDDDDYELNYISEESKMSEDWIVDIIDRQDLLNFVTDPIAKAKLKKLKNPFEDKIVIIGSSLAEDHDFKETPYFSYDGKEFPMPGLEIHANAIQQLIDMTYINVPTKTLNLSSESFTYHVLIILIFIIIVLFITNHSSIIFGTISTLTILLIWFSISMGLFINDHLWLYKWIFDIDIDKSTIEDSFIILPVFFPMAATFITYGSNLCYKIIIEQKDKRFLKDTFGHYVAPQLIDEMYESKKMPELGGESGIRTAFFSDVESFSRISSQLSASQLVELLNEFLSAQTDIILEHRGTLDKYEGDAILAFFGAPIFFENHAEQALIATVNLFDNLEKLKVKWQKEGDKWPEIVHNMNMRVGINTGEMVTGNMGSKQHMNYTMMGEVVNLAARLESGAKLYGVYFLTTYDTLVEAGIEKFEWRYVDRTIFIGFDKWFQTVEILGFKGKIHQDEIMMVNIYQKGLEAFYNRKWEDAIKCFKESEKHETIRHKKNINPSMIYLDRAKQFFDNPPPKDWDGSFQLEEK